MPVYQNKALQDQIMRVATQGQQRSVNSKARQAAVAKAIGSTGQVAAKAYSANAAEVMKQAKELGLSSPEEIAGLKKVMEISERTGLTVEEITGSPKLMEDLMREAKGRRVKQDKLDESIGELSEMRRVKEEEIGTANTYKDVAEESVLDAEFDSLVADEETRGMDRIAHKIGIGGALQERFNDKYLKAADVGYDALAVRQGEEAFAEDVGSELSSLNQQKEDLSRRISSKEAERKANVMSPDRAAKLKALQSMGLTTDQLNAARRSVASGQKLDKLASSNLVGRDMVGRMASEGSRAGMKELRAQKAAAAQIALKNRELDQSASKSAGKVRSDAIKDMTSFATKNIIYSDLSQMRMRNLADFTAIKDVGVGAGLSHNDATVLAESMIKGRQESSIINFEKALSAQEYKSAMLGLSRERLDQDARQHTARSEAKVTADKTKAEATVLAAEKLAARKTSPAVPFQKKGTSGTGTSGGSLKQKEKLSIQLAPLLAKKRWKRKPDSAALFTEISTQANARPGPAKDALKGRWSKMSKEQKRALQDTLNGMSEAAEVPVLDLYKLLAPSGDRKGTDTVGAARDKVRPSDRIKIVK